MVNTLPKQTVNNRFEKSNLLKVTSLLLAFISSWVFIETIWVLNNLSFISKAEAGGVRLTEEQEAKYERIRIQWLTVINTGFSGLDVEFKIRFKKKGSKAYRELTIIFKWHNSSIFYFKYSWTPWEKALRANYKVDKPGFNFLLDSLKKQFQIIEKF